MNRGNGDPRSADGSGSASGLHPVLVAALWRHLCATYHHDVQVADDPTGQPPPLIGRHRPELYLVTDSGLAVVGTAKAGPDLRDAATQEQLDDFTLHHGRNGERAMLWLAVPVGWRRQAIEAIADAAGEIHDRVYVLEVPLPD